MSTKGWTFEPFTAELNNPPQSHEMTRFWGRVLDEQGRFISHIGQADAEALFARSESASTTWIPVSERLPENTTAYEVLVLSVRGKVRVEAACEVVGLWNDAQRYEEKCALTHWMPLPEAPK